jgi:serine/threonine protein kinase
VTLGSQLGRGQSGVVYHGTFADRNLELAIKTRGDTGFVVGGAAVVADEALILEAMLLNGLRHPGIVALMAVVTTGAPILVCTELMENGNLRDYLRACRPDKRLGAIAGSRTQPTPVTSQLMIAWAAILSSALAFLEQQSIIHRDVAARNVLVGKSAAAVKLADLGAARNVHRTCEADYSGVYVATTDHTPARWMPLEALREAKFSHKSDVFGFGVLLWEILSLGQTPWGVFGVPEFSQALAKGERLGFPPRFELGSTNADVDTATKIYSVALRCWKEVPAKRPHFHQLEAEFAVHHTVMATAAVRAALGGASGIGESAPRADRCRTSVDEKVDWKITALDANGYVTHCYTHTDAQQLPIRDSGDCVADDKCTPLPVLDASGYVEETVVLEAKCVSLHLGGTSSSSGSDSKRHLAGNDASLAFSPREMSPIATTQPSTKAGNGASNLGGDVAGTNGARQPTLIVRPGPYEHIQTPASTQKLPISNGSYDASTAKGHSKSLQLSTNWQHSATTLADDDASSAPPRKAIAARTARKPSLYLGFEEGDPSGVHDVETRLYLGDKTQFKFCRFFNVSRIRQFASNVISSLQHRRCLISPKIAKRQSRKRARLFVFLVQTIKVSASAKQPHVCPPTLRFWQEHTRPYFATSSNQPQ